MKLNIKKTSFFGVMFENFGVKAFMKLNNENIINILAFWSTNFGVYAL